MMAGEEDEVVTGDTMADDPQVFPDQDSTAAPLR